MNDTNAVNFSFSNLNKKEKIFYTIRKMSSFQKFIFGIFFVLSIFSGVMILEGVNKYFTVEVPTLGGEVREGVVGIPRFINPVLAISEVDKDLASLVYSGLIRIDKDNNIIPDLAESYTISEDGLTYDFKIKSKATFSDGRPVTSDDIIFTISKIQDKSLKSPKRASFGDVEVRKIDDKNLSFILNKAYSPFIYNLNIGILPKHIWENLNAEYFNQNKYNLEPIGSGAYKISKINYDENKIPVNYELVYFKNFALGRPFIERVIFDLSKDQDELKDKISAGLIDNFMLSNTENIRDYELDFNTNNINLPRVFGVFLNQSEAPILAYKEIREALNDAIDRERIAKEVLGGYNKIALDPIPLSMNLEDKEYSQIKTEEIKSKLSKKGWNINKDGILEKVEKTGKGKTEKKETKQVRVELITADIKEFKKTAEIIKENWQSLGVDVSIAYYNTGELGQNFIKNRKYQMLLFGEAVGVDGDLYPFWHSSQRNDPGLNIANYVNSKADKILENIRDIEDRNERLEEYKKLKKLFVEDVPAFMIYYGNNIYMTRKDVKNFSWGLAVDNSNRFDFLHTWYKDTEWIWKFLLKKNN